MSERPYLFVENAADLPKVADVIAHAKQVGIDAEMNGLHAFRARVCVLQVATDEHDVVIDTVAVPDLEPLRGALTRDGVTRFAHGAAHDVKCLKTDFGLPIPGLFDTYVAAQLLGVEKLGYGDIVQQRFGVTLDKALQTADWGKRPLDAKSIAYLRGDIRFLIPLGRQLHEELVAKELLEEAEYEFLRVAALPAEESLLAEDAYLKPKEARDLAPPGLAVLRELFIARHALAKSLDRPPFKVAGDHVLLDIAKKLPADKDALGRLPGLPRHGASKVVGNLFAAVQRGIEARTPPPIVRAPQPHVGGDEIRARRAREDAFRAWRKRHATARAVPPMAVLPSYALEELVRAPAQSLEDLATRPGMIPKRLKLYGEELIALSQGRPIPAPVEQEKRT